MAAVSNISAQPQIEPSADPTNLPENTSTHINPEIVYTILQQNQLWAEQTRFLTQQTQSLAQQLHDSQLEMELIKGLLRNGLSQPQDSQASRHSVFQPAQTHPASPAPSTQNPPSTPSTQGPISAPSQQAASTPPNAPSTPGPVAASSTVVSSARAKKFKQSNRFSPISLLGIIRSILRLNKPVQGQNSAQQPGSDVANFVSPPRFHLDSTNQLDSTKGEQYRVHIEVDLPNSFTDHLTNQPENRKQLSDAVLKKINDHIKETLDPTPTSPTFLQKARKAGLIASSILAPSAAIYLTLSGDGEILVNKVVFGINYASHIAMTVATYTTVIGTIGAIAWYSISPCFKRKKPTPTPNPSTEPKDDGAKPQPGSPTTQPVSGSNLPDKSSPILSLRSRVSHLPQDQN